MTLSTEQNNQLFQREAFGLVGKAVDTVDHTFYFETKANAEVVERTFILSHGANGSGRFMNPVALKILDEIPNSKVVILDLPFHGHTISSVGEDKANVNYYAEAVAEALPILKEQGELEGVLHWVGWSMGGSIGLLLDLKGVGLNELTLLNSSPVWESVGNLVPTLPVDDKVTLGAIFKKIFLDEVAHNSEQGLVSAIEENYEDITASATVGLKDFEGILPEQFNVVDELQNIQAKTLVVGGKLDGVAEERFQYVMAEKIPNAHLLVTEDNHIQLVKPVEVDRIVKAIINRINN